MKILLLLIIGLGLLITNNVYAQIQTRTSDSLVTFDDKGKGSWMSEPKWIENYVDYQGKPVYVPYNLYNSTNHITYESSQISLTAYRNTCSIKLFNSDHVTNYSKPLIKDISFDLQQAQNGTDNWIETDANSNQCVITFSEAENGVTLDMQQQGSFVTKDIQFKLYDDLSPEAILQVKNNDVNNTNTKYGFAVSLTGTPHATENGDMIEFTNQTNQVLELDTQNSVNHYLWATKISNGTVTLDYKKATGPLLPNQILEIDPTLVKQSTFFAENGMAVTTSSCSTFGSTQAQNQIQRGGASGSSADFCIIAAERFDISSIPNTAIISSVQLNGTGNISSGGTAFDVTVYPTDPSTDSGTTVYNTVTSPSGTYVSSTSCCLTSAAKLSLGSTAITNLKAGTSNFFAVGFKPNPYTQNFNANALNDLFTKVQLVVNYTMPVPNAVTNVACNPIQALGINCSWNNATSIGGKVQGFYITRNGTSEPLYSSNLIGYWKLDGLDAFNTVFDYSKTKANFSLASGSFINKTGIVGNSENFSGNTWTNQISNSAYSFERTNPISFTFWEKPIGSNGQNVILYKMAYPIGWYISELGDGRPSFVESGSGGIGSNTIYTYPTIPNGLNKWANWDITYDGSSSANGVNFYLNGTLVSKTIVYNNLVSSIITASGLVIGSNTNINSGFEGTLDDLRIYKGVLPISQIKLISNYRLNTLSKLDNYQVLDGRNYQYCVYPVNQYGQNHTGTCSTTFAANYATPPNQLNGKFYKDGSNHYNVQINWTTPAQFLKDTFTATGYQLQKWTGSTWSTIFTNTTSLSYTDSSPVQATTQKYRLYSWNHLGLSSGYTFENQNNTSLKTLYQFDNNTLDSRGTNTIIMTGLQNYTLGPIGYSLALDGNTTGKSTASGIPNGTSDRTVSVWLHPAAFTSNSNAYVSQGSGASNSQFSLIDANSHIDCGGAGNNVNTTGTLTANKWELVTCVLSNSGQTRSIYLNGTLDKSSTTTAINTPASSIYIGTRIDNTNRNVTGFEDNLRWYATALNSTQISELFNQTITSRDNNNINNMVGTHTLTSTVIGDISNQNATVTITTGFPSPILQTLKLYNYTNLLNTTTLNQIIIPGTPIHNTYGNWINVTTLHQFKSVATISNGTATKTINSSTVNSIATFKPTYIPSIQGPYLVNYTLARPSPGSQIGLTINENPITFEAKCQFATGPQILANVSGTWDNRSNIGYYLANKTVHNYDTIYIACYDPNQLLFQTTSYGNGSSLLPGIQYLDSSFNGFIGVPMGVFFILIISGLATGKTAPTVLIVVLAVAAILGALGFFVIQQGVWGLCLIAGALCIFAGKKLF